MWADRLGVTRSSDGTVDFNEFVRAVITAGTTDNGVFAARIMWGTLDEVVDKLKPVFPDVAGSDLDLLNRAFGNTRFIYLQREDVLAQAVSWLRAEQGDVWVETYDSQPEKPKQEPHFDFDRIHELIEEIGQHNKAWQDWFASVDVEPYAVRYEDLDADPVGVTQGILKFLGLDLLAGHKIASMHRRLADDLNTEWAKRYKAELATSHVRPSSSLQV
jgi:LPS sulfotransferase NodH